MSNLSSVKSEQINESKGSGVDKSVEETENEVATEEELDQLAEVIKKKSERRVRLLQFFFFLETKKSERCQWQDYLPSWSKYNYSILY